MRFPPFRIDDVPFAVVRDAELWIDDDGTPRIDPSQIQSFKDHEHAGKRPLVGDEIQVAIRDPLYFRHYFHFMETFLTLFSVQNEIAPTSRITDIILGNLDWDNPQQANVQRHLFSLVYPSAKISADVTIKKSRISSLIYIDRHSMHTSINKMLDPSLFLVCKWAQTLRHLVYQALGIEDQDLKKEESLKHSPKILYVPRNPPRCLSAVLEKRLIAFLEEVGTVDLANFAELSWQDQVRLTADHDILIGVHGNGLTNLLWLPKHGTAIELFDESVRQYDYQVLAEAMGIDYFGIGGNHMYRPFSREWRVRGNAGTPVTNLVMKNIELAFQAFSIRTGIPLGRRP